MPLFDVDIEKRLSSEFWTNRYIVQAPNLAGAQAVASDIVLAERNLHYVDITFTRYRVSSTAVGDGIYTIVPVNAGGLVGAEGSTLLPLFNTLRIDMSATTGRPSRKYYRGCLAEKDINGDAMVRNATAFIADLESYFGSATVPGIVDPQGEVLVRATVHPFVQMRQLRRSRRRRSNGGGIFQ